MNRSLKSGGIFPSTFNVAAKADISVNATCGEEGPETFCKPSESSRCGVCDARSPDPGKRHNISNILDSSPGKWWQSPSLARGDRYEYVTIVLDLKQVRKEAFASRVKSLRSLLLCPPYVRKGRWWSPPASVRREKTAFYSKFYSKRPVYTIYPPSPPSLSLSLPPRNSSGVFHVTWPLKGRLVDVSATGPFRPFRKIVKSLFPQLVSPRFSHCTLRLLSLFTNLCPWKRNGREGRREKGDRWIGEREREGGRLEERSWVLSGPFLGISRAASKAQGYIYIYTWGPREQIGGRKTF